MNNTKELPIIQMTYDIIKWLIPNIDKLPRTQKFVLGDRIEIAFLDFLKYISLASKTKDKYEILTIADAKLMEIKLLCRLIVDLKYISIKQFEYLSKQLSEMGKMLGGWIKSIECRK
ncbi:diversity-generating retroelement protein Avd [bacterium]|nr:diversity-generating retroelement protein Avd [bacterium]